MMDEKNAVKALREALKESQAEFAQRIGISQVAVSNYERGRSPEPIISRNLAKLADQVAPHLSGVFIAHAENKERAQLRRVTVAAERQIEIRTAIRCIDVAERLGALPVAASLREEFGL